MKSLIRNKRGDVMQIIPLIVILLIIALIGLISMFLSWKFTKSFDETGLLDSQPNAKAVNQNFIFWIPQINDEMILFFFIGMTIGLIIAAIKTNFNPAIIFVFILLLFVAIFLAAQAVNIYRGFADDPSLKEYSQKLTFTDILFSKYMPLIIVCIGGLVLIIMYSKSGSNIPI